MKSVKVAILGAGTAGLAARRQVAKKTDDYVVIDPGPLGTTCARVGCMPSKALIQVAEDFYRRHQFGDYGIAGADALSLDSARVMGHVRALRDRFVGHVLDGMESWCDGRLIQARAEFADDGEIVAGDERVRAKRVIIATGSSPVMPPEWREHYGERVHDTDSFFDLDRLPRSAAVIGLGVIGIELGQALARLGVDVCAFDDANRIGGLSDPCLQNLAMESFGREIEIVPERAALSFGEDGSVTAGWEGGERVVDAVIAAAGRRPNLTDLGLEKVGVSLDDRGRVDVDPATLRIKGSSIFVAGDVNGVRPVLHEASDEGAIAGYNAVHDDEHTFKRRVGMTITFCDPQIAMVGDSYEALCEREADFVVGEASFDDQGRARVAGRLGGCVRVYAARSDGRLLGSEMLAPGAEHFAHMLARALEAGFTVQEALATPFYHPVLQEGVRTALRDAAKKTETGAPEFELMRCVGPAVESFD